jgi:alpha-galactosidase
MTNNASGAEVWTKKLSDKSLAVGIFNRGKTNLTANLVWRDLGLSAKPAVRDLWLRLDLARSKHFSTEILPHGCVLLRVK